MKNVVYLFFALMLVFSACSDDNDEQVRTLSVDKTELIFEDLEVESEQSFRIISNINWKLIGEDNQAFELKISKDNGGAAVKVSIDPSKVKKTDLWVLVIEGVDDPLLNARVTIKCIVKEPNAFDLVEDEIFKDYLINSVFEGNSYITASDAAKVTVIDVSGTKEENNEIKSLNGIEIFKNLVELKCDYNKIATLDLSKNKNLKKLSVINNELVSLDLSNNASLVEVLCSDNQITSLDISNNIDLTFFSCSKNQLTLLDLSKNVKLMRLDCDENKLKSLNVSKNTALTDIYCAKNELTALDLSNNKKLSRVTCSTNQITSLDVSNNEEFRNLYCDENKLTSLNILNCPILRTLDCQNNQLTSLDLSTNANLTSLYCSDNALSVLDVSKNANLTYFYCNRNELTSLDLSKNAKLKSFYGTNNPFANKSVTISQAVYDSASLFPSKKTEIYNVVD